MPQVDLETLVSVIGGGSTNDRKIACETLATTTVDDPSENPELPSDVPPDFPPESFWLSKDAELDWFDRNAFLERKDSTKGSNSNNSTTPNLNPTSQRFSKASIIGLPKTQKASYVDPKRRICKPGNFRLFPKRSNSVPKSTSSIIEPSSPKVSCMGRVRSKRGRRRPSETGKKKEKPVENVRTGERKPGFCSSLISILKSGKRREKQKPVGPGFETKKEKVNGSVKARAVVNVGVEPVGEPPGLGGMKRFESGRKLESWVG